MFGRRRFTDQSGCPTAAAANDDDVHWSSRSTSDATHSTDADAGNYSNSVSATATLSRYDFINVIRLASIFTFARRIGRFVSPTVAESETGHSDQSVASGQMVFVFSRVFYVDERSSGSSQPESSA